MAVTPCSDLSAASWITNSDRPWQQLIGLGPSGFPAYARLRYLTDPTHAGQSESDVELDDDAPLEHVQLGAALQTLAHHTRTPDDCYFCIWDGWGWTVEDGDGTWTPELEPDTAQAEVLKPSTPLAASTPGFQRLPGYPRPATHAPKVVVPNRSYFLFRGSVTDFGDWDAAQMRPEQDAGMPDPAFIWPADRSWCIANDVDPHWAGIGADTVVIDQLLADPRLDVVRADPGEDQPRYW